MRELWVARHGATADSEAGVMNGDPARQKSLSEAGREQALAMAGVLAAEPIAVCLVSEFSRTAETAGLALAGRDIEPRVTRELNEVRCGGTFERGPYTEYVSWCLQHGLFARPPGAGGDYMADTLLRVHDAWRDIISRPEDTGLVVTHGMLVSFALRMPSLRPGQTLFPLPQAHPGGLHRLDPAEMSRGLTHVPGLVLAAAQADEAGRQWARRRGLR